MEQRRPRLGDIVDDYCPRERRLANHVVVAMIGEDIKQTRCTTCDAEHVYKNARVPPKRKKADSTAALVKQVADGLVDKPRLSADAATASAEHEAPEPAVHVPEPASPPVPPHAEMGAAPPADAPADTPDPATGTDEARVVEEGPVHRQLIRATLPRLPGEEREARPIPEFTMRAVRNARPFRQGGGRPGGGKGGGRGPKGRAAAANFRPGVMSSWSPSNQRPKGGAPPHGNRAPQGQGRKKSR